MNLKCISYFRHRAQRMSCVLISHIYRFVSQDFHTHQLFSWPSLSELTAVHGPTTSCLFYWKTVVLICLLCIISVCLHATEAMWPAKLEVGTLKLSYRKASCPWPISNFLSWLLYSFGLNCMSLSYLDFILQTKLCFLSISKLVVLYEFL